MADSHSDTTSASAPDSAGRNTTQPPPASRAGPTPFQSDGETGSKAVPKDGAIDFTLEGGEMAAASREAMLTAARFWQQALEPFQAFQASMMRWSDQLWRDAAGGARPAQISRLLTPAPILGLPSTDVKETEQAYTVSMELPGLTERDVSISTDDDQLILQGDKTQEQNRETSTYRRSERWFGHFERTFPLPPGVARDRISSSMRDGVLQVVLPKAASVEAAPRTEVRH